MKEKIFRSFSLDLPNSRHEDAFDVVSATLEEHCLDTECGTFRWQRCREQTSRFVLFFATITRLLGFPLVRQNQISLQMRSSENRCIIAIEAACATRESGLLAHSVVEETIVAAHKVLEELREEPVLI